MSPAGADRADTVHALIERGAARAPDAVYAISLVDGRVLRYGEQTDRLRGAAPRRYLVMTV